MHVCIRKGSVYPHVDVDAVVHAHLGVHLTLFEVLELGRAVQVELAQSAAAPRDRFLQRDEDSLNYEVV